MFHSTPGLKIDTSFGGVFQLNVEQQHLGITPLPFAAVSILTESGCKFGIMHFVFTIYMQNVDSSTSCS